MTADMSRTVSMTTNQRLAYMRGWHDATWNTYRGHGETERASYDMGHAAGVEERETKSADRDMRTMRAGGWLR